jgi:hypothetical protein
MEEKYEEKDAPRPRIWCGRSDTLPAGYDEIGTSYNCLRKGVGVGKYVLLGRDPPSGPGVSPEKYCGTANTLPDGKTRFGNRYECLKTGVGVGLHLQNAVPAGINHGRYVKSGLVPISENIDPPRRTKKKRPKKTKTRARAAKNSRRPPPELAGPEYEPDFFEDNGKYEPDVGNELPMDQILTASTGLLVLATVLYIGRLVMTKDRYKPKVVKEDYKKRHFRWVHG